MLQDRRIHVCVTGGIAAYKAALLVRALQVAGASVQVAMTPNSQAFVGALTFQALTGKPVLDTTLDAGQEQSIGHIEFAQTPDLIVVAPATANIIAKMANGLGDEIVSTVLLAASVPVLIAPAMNSSMWAHPAVQQNVERLRAWGTHIVEPHSGQLACGTIGPGRLAPIPDIMAGIEKALTAQRLAGRKVVISAGPTREAIDPARFLSNPSTGRAGFAIASAARAAGAEVVLVHGPVALEAPPGVQMVSVLTAIEMRDAIFAAQEGADVVVMSAAVADYRPADYSDAKIKKGGAMTLALARNPDILAELGANRSGDRPMLVGFAAESGDPVAAAQAKRLRKGVDLIVANDITAPGAGFASKTNQVTLVTADEIRPLPMQSKTALGRVLVNWIADRLGAS